jgi:hypothetical protein
MTFATTAALAIAVATPTPPRPDDSAAWAVVGLAGAGVWATDVERVEDGVRAALARSVTGRIQPRAATAALLAEARQGGLLCDVREPSCSAKMGVAAGVDRVLLLEATMVGGAMSVELTLVDVDAEVVLGRGNRLLDAAAPQAALLEDVILELRFPGLYFGALDVVGAPSGARVLVDGEERGAAPLAGPVERLRPGAHHVEVRSSGETWRSDIEVRAGETARAEVSFAAAAPAPAPLAAAPPVTSAQADAEAPMAIGLPLAIGGGAVAAVAAASAVGLAAWLETPIERDARAGVRVAGLASLGVLGAGAIAAAAGVALWLMDAPAEGT